MGAQSIDQTNAGQEDLELSHISKRFGSLQVIDDLTLPIHRGELCCLLGPSGCGKTTTLRIIAGFVSPDAGTVRLAGADITHMPPQRRNVGLVFQNYALFPHMNVYENVAYGLRRRKWPEARIKPKVDETLRLVRLQGYEMRRIHELSGGQQQRVALARALIIEPRLLLLDEPLSNLDARLRTDMRDEIRRIQRALNITTIYVTHDQKEAMSIADRIVVMNKRAIEQVGTPREIYERPATEFVADFIGHANLLSGRMVDGRLLLLGKHFCPAHADWSEGMSVTCAIRPERVRVVVKRDAPFNGVIQEMTFLGATVRYRVALAQGDRLDLVLPSPGATYQAGQEIGLDLCLEDMCFFT